MCGKPRPMQMKRAVSRCTARRSNASRRATGRAAPVAYAAHAGTRATHVPHVRVTPAIRGCANRRPPIDAGAHPSKQARRRHRADRRDARGRAIAAGALIDPEPLAVLPRDPGGRAAAPRPCRARVRIAIARLRQRVGFLRPSEARRKQVFLRETVFDDLLAQPDEHVGQLERAGALRLLLQIIQLGKQFLVCCHYHFPV
ncbi:hypothetical protein DP49_4832 [Burkholderia pseudomallei]|nr:hypothetical protein DP49_4832 [Burkholderia pseudomallei]